jgi:hypothetical protein
VGKKTWSISFLSFDMRESVVLASAMWTNTQ